MATAYAALLSLSNTITLEQRPRYHPHRQISIHDGGLIQDLQESVNIWVIFFELELLILKEHLEKRLVQAAYAAEDAIESYVVDQVLPTGDTIPGDKKSAVLCQHLVDVIQEMDSILMEMSLFPEMSAQKKDKHHGNSKSAAGSLSNGALLHEKCTMVGFEDEKKRVMDELLYGDSPQKLIFIVGMGGSGKTTLVKNIIGDQLILDHFDIIEWVTVTQDHNVHEILRVLRGEQNHWEGEYSEGNNEALGTQAYKRLFGRRYLIVLDDTWSIDVWNEIQKFLPDDAACESRIMLTTRISYLATKVRRDDTAIITMKLLNEIESWDLFCETVFGQNRTCPLHLTDVGKEISQNCKGLPLSIVVVGRLIAGDTSLEFWNHVAKQSVPTMTLDEEGHCLKILSLSYNNLPICLKLCFLSMGVFPEDHVISISVLINLWTAEGFLKPCKGKTCKETALGYLWNLILRNLITIHKLDLHGDIEYCTIHDLLRELCLREAQKEKFLCVITPYNLQNPLNMNGQRRIAILLGKSKTETNPHFIDSLLSTSNPRSLTVNNYKESSQLLKRPIFKLLRVFVSIHEDQQRPREEHLEFSKVLLNLVNLRYLACKADFDGNFMDASGSSIGLLGNLQALVVRNLVYNGKVPSEIWSLPQLCHVAFNAFSLLEPLSGKQEEHDSFVLQNLQTIQGLVNFKFEEGILEKINNVKEMDIWYAKGVSEHEEWSIYRFYNLAHLKELQSFTCTFFPYLEDCSEVCNDLLGAIPHSLKKLSLSGCNLPWEQMTVIGELPNLEVLELRNASFKGDEWNPVEGQFLRLRCLIMRCLYDLAHWNADNSHFPCLKFLVLVGLELKKIPLEIGDIPTLQGIWLDHCSDSAVKSAQTILEEQQEFGNTELQVRITYSTRNEFVRLALENRHKKNEHPEPDESMEHFMSRHNSTRCKVYAMLDLDLPAEYVVDREAVWSAADLTYWVACQHFTDEYAQMLFFTHHPALTS